MEVMAAHLDGDGLPIFPSLPGARPPAAPARSLASLVAGLDSGVLMASGDALAAMVVFVDGRPVDGLAFRGGRRTVGTGALDEIADLSVADLSAAEVSAELARALGSWFLPLVVRAFPARLVVPETFILSLAREGVRGCALVRAAAGLGVVFFASGRILLAHRHGHDRIGGLGDLADLLADPGATLWIRSGSARGDEVSPVRPSAAVPPPAPAPGSPALVEAVVAEVRAALGRNGAGVEAVFREAEPTPDGLRAAARSLPARPRRLVSPATLEMVAARVQSVIDSATAS